MKKECYSNDYIVSEPSRESYFFKSKKDNNVYAYNFLKQEINVFDDFGEVLDSFKLTDVETADLKHNMKSFNTTSWGADDNEHLCSEITDIYARNLYDLKSQKELEAIQTTADLYKLPSKYKTKAVVYESFTDKSLNIFLETYDSSKYGRTCGVYSPASIYFKQTINIDLTSMKTLERVKIAFEICNNLIPDNLTVEKICYNTHEIKEKYTELELDCYGNLNVELKSKYESRIFSNSKYELDPAEFLNTVVDKIQPLEKWYSGSLKDIIGEVKMIKNEPIELSNKDFHRIEISENSIEKENFDEKIQNQ